jgi:hypothetical protein
MIMVGELSEDGQYMWDGNGWVPKPSFTEILPPSVVDQTQVVEVASQIGVNADSLANAAPYFDQNRDGQLQRSELEQAAVAIANPPPAGSRGGNGSPPSLKINNDDDDKPWQIKTVSILIIIMASLGGVIGQQVSKIDEKATKLENNAARNMSAARALETLENQDVFRDETMLVEAKSLMLTAEGFNSSIGLGQSAADKAWKTLLEADIERTLLKIVKDGEWDQETLTSWLCQPSISYGCDAYFISEVNTSAEYTFICDNGEEIPSHWVNDGFEDCEDGSDEGVDIEGESTGQSCTSQCSLRLVVTRDRLDSFNITESGDIYSFATLYDVLEEKAGNSEAFSWSNSSIKVGSITEAGPGGVYVSNNDSGTHPSAMDSENPDMWKCDYSGAICVDIALSGDWFDLVASEPIFYSGLDLNGEGGVQGMLSLFQIMSTITEMKVAEGAYLNDSGMGSELEIIMYNYFSNIYASRNLILQNAYNQNSLTLDAAESEWYSKTAEITEMQRNYHALLNQSRTLIEDTSAWQKGFVSNDTGEFISDESKNDYMLEAYSDSAAKYEVADNQSQEAADKRAKAGAVYSSILYISVATALCGIVSGRVGSNKYIMTLPMVLVAMGSFGYGCYIFASGIMI